MNDDKNLNPAPGSGAGNNVEELTEKQKKHKKFIEELRHSVEVLGYLHPVLKSRFGIIAGNSRIEADLNWPVKEVFVDSPYEHYRLEAGDNQREEKDDEWWKSILIKAANELLNTGTPKGKIAKKLHEEFPVGRDRLLRLLPADFKDQHQVEAAKALAQKRKANAYDKIIQEQWEERERKQKEADELDRALKKGRKGVFSKYKPPVNVVLDDAYEGPTENERYIVAELVTRGIKFMCGAVFAKSETKDIQRDAYILPIYMELKGKRGLGFDVEGNPNSPKDDYVRQSYFEKRGIDLIWIPKEFAVKYSKILAELLSVIIW